MSTNEAQLYTESKFKAEICSSVVMMCLVKKVVNTKMPSKWFAQKSERIGLLINPNSGLPRSGRPRRGFKAQGRCVFPLVPIGPGRSPGQAVRVESIGNHYTSGPLQSLDEIRRRCRENRRQSRHFWLGKSKIFYKFLAIFICVEP